MKRKAVIVGGGFGGIEVAKALGNHPQYEVTVIDRRNYSLFQPLLYQVAMAGLSPAEIAVPIRSILSKYKNTKVFLGNVDRLDLNAKKIHSDIGALSYDVLVLACGAKHSYFGKPEWEEFAPGLKTLEQATEIRRRVLTAFELAEREDDDEVKQRCLTFVVVGGGPTGVELAGAIAELSHFTLSKDFRHIHPENAKIFLIEAGERILRGFAPELSESAQKTLTRLGVTVWTKSRVTDINAQQIVVNEKILHSNTILWAAGVQASSLNLLMPSEKDSQGRVFVNPDLTLSGFPEVYVIGDQAHAKDEKGNPLPGLAPVAIQQGRYVGKILAQSGPKLPFRYLDKGQMATIGRKTAVLEYRNIKIFGFGAWVAWLFVHIFYLIGFKNRLFVFFQWAWHYLSYGRGARLIVHKEWRAFLNK